LEFIDILEKLKNEGKIEQYYESRDGSRDYFIVKNDANPPDIRITYQFLRYYPKQIEERVSRAKPGDIISRD
jgi:hypothetical protein